MILISKGGTSIVKLNPKQIGQEEFLQSYINANPEVIPLDDLKDGIRLLVLGREFPTPSGPIDLLAIDQDGELYVIETKLFKNADKRRVIAQMLDYGAALWDHPSDEFIRNMNSVSKSQFGNMSLTERVNEFLNEDELDADHIVEQVIAHKEAGSITFIVLMDQIETRLKTLIRYVNANSKFDIFGVSLDFYEHQDTEIIIPDLYGAEVRKEIESKSSSGSQRSWDEPSFFEKARSQLNDDEVEVLSQLYSWAAQEADLVRWGKGKVNGSFGPVFPDMCARTLFAAYSDATICVHFGSPNDSEELKVNMGKLAKALEATGLITIDRPIEKFEPVIPGSALIGRVEQFTTLFKEHLGV